MSALSEDDVIAHFFAPIAGPGALGLRDDAAPIAPPIGQELVLTKDAVVAGVHFFADDPPASIARKALRVNLSDLAAKGADPLGFLIAIALPAEAGVAWLGAFAAALGADAAAYAIPLLGGDTVRTPGPLTISVTALGAVPVGRMARRDGARAGDRLYVSGTIGDAALGLKLRMEPGLALGEPHRAHLLARYLEPQPRLALRAAMREHANAGMDVSDGLIGDLTKMLRVSGVTAQARLAKVPISEAARAALAAHPALRDVAFTGGDDYEILAAVPPAAAAAFETAAADAGVAVAWMGDVSAGEGPPEFLDADGAARRFVVGSYSHF